MEDNHSFFASATSFIKVYYYHSVEHRADQKYTKVWYCNILMEDLPALDHGDHLRALAEHLHGEGNELQGLVPESPHRLPRGCTADGHSHGHRFLTQPAVEFPVSGPLAPNVPFPMPSSPRADGVPGFYAPTLPFITRPLFFYF